MTFDKKFYEFAGECSYLLARDFIDGKFAVIVNYDNVHGQMTKKSITAYVGDKEIEIYPRFKVELYDNNHFHNISWNTRIMNYLIILYVRKLTFIIYVL